MFTLALSSEGSVERPCPRLAAQPPAYRGRFLSSALFSALLVVPQRQRAQALQLFNLKLCSPFLCLLRVLCALCVKIFSLPQVPLRPFPQFDFRVLLSVPCFLPSFLLFPFPPPVSSSPPPAPLALAAAP